MGNDIGHMVDIAIISVITSGIVAIVIACITHYYSRKGAQDSHDNRLIEMGHQFKHQEKRELEQQRKEALFSFITFYHVALESYKDVIHKLLSYNEMNVFDKKHVQFAIVEYNRVHCRVYEDPSAFSTMWIEFAFYWKQYNVGIYSNANNFREQLLEKQEPIISFLNGLQVFEGKNIKTYITQCKIFNSTLKDLSNDFEQLITLISDELTKDGVD